MNSVIRKIVSFWKDDSGVSEMIASIGKAIFAIAGTSIVLGIIYTAFKVFAAKTGGTILNISP